jgi:putative endonuclease
MYYVYLLESLTAPGHHHVGYTSDLKVRLSHHNSGKNPSTSPHRPWNLAAYIGFPAERKAMAFERYLKSGSGRTFAKRHFL